MAKRFAYIVGLLLIACWASTGGAQTTQFSLELGYQWTSISGNEDVFRSQVNEQPGVLLRSFSLTSFDSSSGSKLFDRMRIDAAGLGASPDGRLLVDAGLAGAYNLRLVYRHGEYFNALPDFANPLLGSGVVLGQHTMNRKTDSMDLDVELIPGHTLTPLVGYRWVHTTGPGQTTYHIGQDEFQLNDNFSVTSQEVRVGLGFHLGTFAGSIQQGWRFFDQTDTTSLLAGAGGGNNTKPVLGQDITLSSFTGSANSSGTTPITTAYVSGMLANRVRLVGSYVRADFKSDTTGDELASGDLASFKLARFYGGRSESVQSKAETESWRGDARVEAELLDGIELIAGYAKQHRALDGWATISDLYTDTINFSGADPKDVSTLINAQTAMTRDDEAVEAKVTVRNLGPVQLWAAYSKINQDVNVTPDAAEIVVPGGQGGSYSRDVDRTSAGVSAVFSDLRLGLDWKKDDADAAIVRTDFLNLERWRARLNWTAGKLLQLVGTAEQITGDNPTPGIDEDLTVKHYAADLVVTPVEALMVRLGYGVYKADSTIIIRRPQDFVLEPWLYTEDGTSTDAAVSYKHGRFAVGAAYTKFKNTGNQPLNLDRTNAYVDVDLTSTWGVIAQYDKRKYEQVALPIANYDANWYGFFVRWRN